MWPNLQFPADLVTFTEEILNAKLHFLTHFWPMFSFFLSWKQQKTFVSRGYKMETLARNMLMHFISAKFTYQKIWSGWAIFDCTKYNLHIKKFHRTSLWQLTWSLSGFKLNVKSLNASANLFAASNKSLPSSSSFPTFDTTNRACCERSLKFARLLKKIKEC